jgi:hypothetical protein
MYEVKSATKDSTYENDGTIYNIIPHQRKGLDKWFHHLCQVSAAVSGLALVGFLGTVAYGWIANNPEPVRFIMDRIESVRLMRPWPQMGVLTVVVLDSVCFSRSLSGSNEKHIPIGKVNRSIVDGQESIEITYFDSRNQPSQTSCDS